MEGVKIRRLQGLGRCEASNTGARMPDQEGTVTWSRSDARGGRLDKSQKGGRYHGE